MAEVNDIHTFLKGWKETDAPALVASATDNVSQLEPMMVENEIKKINTSQKALSQNCPRNNRKRGWEISTTSWNQSNSQAIQ